MLRFYDIGEALSYERFFPIRVDRCEPVLDNLAGYEADEITSYRWWSLDELHGATDAVFPKDLANLLVPVIQGILPNEPLIIR